jgi:hypothetical protein
MKTAMASAGMTKFRICKISSQAVMDLRLRRGEPPNGCGLCLESPTLKKPSRAAFGRGLSIITA